MHIPDGVLSLPVLAASAVVATGALVVGLRSMDDDRLPRVAVVSAAFFVASLLAVPIGPTSVHLLLSGLMGLMLGWAAIPAVFVALVLQSVFFGFGGLAALGINTVNVALPGVLWAMAAAPLLVRAASPFAKGLVGAAVAALALASAALLLTASLVLSDPGYLGSAALILATYLPLLFAEAALTGVAVAFLARVKPDMLAGRPHTTRNA